jgi:hypothetical protein
VSNPTNPFSWQMPTPTDLVTDLPADFEVFGQAVATSLADLLGGTSGQILAKNSNTDMDFVWIANDQGDITGITASSPLTGGGTSGAVTVGIQDATTAQKGAVQLENSTSSTSTTTAAVPASVKSAYDLADGAIPKLLIDAAGDLIVGTAADTAGRLGIGTANQILRVNSGATALEWAAPPGGGKVLQVVVSANATTFQSIKTASATDVTGMSVSITPSSATSKILIMGMLNGINNQSTGTNAEVVELDLVDGSNVKIFRTNAGQCLPYAYPQMNVPFTYLHSPATTSALTYKLRVTNNTSNYGIYVNNGNSDLTSSMVAMEIGA